MPRSISRRHLIKKLKNVGFSGPYSGGKHAFMSKGALKLRIPNPHQGNLSQGLVAEILRQAQISVKDWEALK
jgi:predicted RNA binding protein YcfA (HicA-like mRNA interferase family)